MSPTGVLILGIPGSGKTSLASALTDRFHAPHFVASRVLREHASRHPAASRTWHRYWERGENAPDAEVLPALWDAFAGYGTTLVFLDGYPRTREQLADFCRRGGNIGLSVLLDIPREVATKRALARGQGERLIPETAALISRRIDTEAAVIADLTTTAPIRESLVRVDSGAHPTTEILARIAPAVRDLAPIF